MAKKPAGLIYGVDDKPPLTASALLGLQHVFVMTSGWVLVVVIVTTIGGTQEEVLSRFLVNSLHLQLAGRRDQSFLITIRELLKPPGEKPSRQRAWRP